MSDTADNPTPGEQPGRARRSDPAAAARGRGPTPRLRDRSRPAPPGGATGRGSSSIAPAIVDANLTGATAADERPTALRMARLHLRMGSTSLARAELESFAGRGALDEAALLDLAEVRWRTGDLAGAGEAANALIEIGREDVLALAIAAEATAALGRPGEARRLAGRAVAAAGGRSIEALFAGMPRSPIWPENIAGDDAPPDVMAERPSTSRPARPHVAAAPAQGSAASAPASPAAAEALAGGLAALGSGDITRAALRLGVALRLEADFADAVIDAIGERATDPQLALVVGDAYRLLGRESEALAAFDRARGHEDDRVDRDASDAEG